MNYKHNIIEKNVNLLYNYSREYMELNKNFIIRKISQNFNSMIIKNKEELVKMYFKNFKYIKINHEITLENFK